MAILPFEKDAWNRTAIVDGEYYDGSGVMDEISTSPNSAGFFHVIGRDPEDGTAIDGFGGDEAGLAGARRFGHGNNIKQASGFGLPASVKRLPLRASGLGHLQSLIAKAGSRKAEARCLTPDVLLLCCRHDC